VNSLVERGKSMKQIFVLALSIFFVGSAALAQNTVPAGDATDKPAANEKASKPETTPPSRPQPQGQTGPTNTTSGGAPANSPQGDTPPGMQPDPKQNDAPKK
jgi:hypothetical protein